MKYTVTKQNVGIDIAKKDFTCCFRQLLCTGRTRIKGSRTFLNNSNGFKAFIQWVAKKKNPVLSVFVTMEATGVYYEQLAYCLHEQTTMQISVLLPNIVKAYAKSYHVKTKTDPVDAKILGLMGLERVLPKWTPATPNMRLLKQHTREREVLLKKRTAVLNQLHACQYAYASSPLQINRLTNLLEFMEDQLATVEQELQALVQQDPKLAERVAHICTTKGLSWKSVLPVIAETGGFALFTSIKQVVSYAGYDVIQRESGSSLKGQTRISKKGNKRIRAALHFSALVAARHEPILKALWERVFTRTQIKMKAYVAVQRKLLVLIYTLFKKNEPYQRTTPAESTLTVASPSKTVCLSQ